MKPTIRKRMTGVSLIELMIALVIGSLLVLGLVEVFSASRTAYQTSEGMSRVQENARFAMDYLQRDIRMAGHYGCVNDQSHLQTAGALQPHFGATPLYALNFGVSIQGYEAPNTAPGDNLTLGAAWTPITGWPAEIAALNPRAGSDIIVLRYLSNQGAPVTALGTAGSNETVTVATGRWGGLTSDGVTNPTLFGIADCTNVDIFAGTGADPLVTVAPAAAPAPATNFAGRYTPQPSGQTMLYRAESLVYYIGNGFSGEPSLFRARFNGANYVPEELVEGIENLQLLYGLDRVTNLAVSPPSGYIDVHNPANAGGAWTADTWRRVGLVQIGMLARSPDRAASTQAASINTQRRVLGVRFQPLATNDGRYRASYEVTTALRNRLYGN